MYVHILGIIYLDQELKCPDYYDMITDISFYLFEIVVFIQGILMLLTIHFIATDRMNA